MKDIVKFAEDLRADAASASGLEDEDWEVLRRHASTTVPWGVEVGRIYVDTIDRDPEARRKNGGVNRLDLQQVFRVWYENLVSGVPGEAFWAETALIGMTHASEGIDNRRVVAMASRVEGRVLQWCVEALPGDAILTVFGAFKRAFGTAVGVMIDAYVGAILVGMAEIGMNERLVGRIRNVAIRRMIEQARDVLPLIDWSESLSVGLPGIDEQHKKLVALINLLHDSSVRGSGNATIGKVLDDLTSYTVDHFAFEERLMEAHGYDGLEEHREAHVALTKQVAKLNEDYKAGSAQLSTELFMFLRSWLNGHIRGTDKLYGPFLASRGVA